MTHPYGSKRIKAVFDPASPQPFNLSRSKIELFIECPRCFYLDRRLGISRPSTPAFTLNSAVDNLLKKEFDLLRRNGEAHELMKQYHIDAVPFRHPELPVWRDDMNQYKGASALDEKTNFMVSGIVDDIWQDSTGKLVIVDYKATSTTKEISLEDKWKQSYKKQMEVYQWIFRKKGFEVSDTGYFIFANAARNRPKFDGKLEFVLSIVPHKGDVSWIEPLLQKIRKVLNSEQLPDRGPSCGYCAYRESIEKATL
jgi:CRISPR/Cas system-associated exonuclease Cas4 (RecB family)